LFVQKYSYFGNLPKKVDMTTNQNEQISPAIPQNLIDREVEVNDFLHLIKQIRNDIQVSHNLIEWHGEPGIGKSTLLKLFVEQCEELKVAHAQINLKEINQQEYLNDPSMLLEQIIRKIAPEHQDQFTSFFSEADNFHAEANLKNIVKRYYELSYDERLYQSPIWLQKLRIFAREFVNCLDKLATTEPKTWRPIVLFFDEADHCDTRLLDWIEEFIIVPFTAKKYFVVIWADRRPWRWKKPELQSRRLSQKLVGFDKANTKRQIQENTADITLAEELFSRVFAITKGHPFAVSVAVDEINARNSSSSNLVTAIFNRVILNYAFQGLHEDHKIALQHLALVRLFDTSMIKEVLQRCAGEFFPEKMKHEEFNLLLQQLTTTQLITWNNNYYSMVPDLRHLIREYYLFEPSSTDKFIAVNKTALDVYKRRIERSFADIPGAIIEEIYHCASIGQVHTQTGEDFSVLNIVEGHLKKFSEWFSEQDARLNALEGFRNRIAHDLDLPILIDPKTLSKMIELIDKELSEIKE